MATTIKDQIQIEDDTHGWTTLNLRRYTIGNDATPSEKRDAANTMRELNTMMQRWSMCEVTVGRRLRRFTSM